MTAVKINAIVCDREGCDEQLQAQDRESAYELRARAARAHGWTSERTSRGPGFKDLCRWHA